MWLSLKLPEKQNLIKEALVAKEYFDEKVFDYSFNNKLTFSQDFRLYSFFIMKIAFLVQKKYKYEDHSTHCSLFYRHHF